MRSIGQYASETTSKPNTDRGVSEVLGYSLVFSLILISVAIVSVSGFSVLENVRTIESAQNADRAYDVLSNNMADIYVEGAPSRATEIDLGDSQLFIAEPVTINVTVTEVGTETSYVYDIRPIVYNLGPEQSLVYENGAVFHVSQQSGVVRQPPPQMIGTTRTHIPLVRTKSSSTQSLGGTTILVRGVLEAQGILHTGTQDVTALHINITSPRADLWQRYYEDEVPTTVGDCDRPTDNRVICELDPPNRILHVTLHDIEMELIS